ncbi:MAG: type II toxin-antitoxin system HicB family antitoxin [bacterium]
MKLLVTIETDEVGWIVAECPALPGCVSQGRTREEALANIQDAIKLSIKSRKELGLPLPPETDAIEVAI